MTAKVDKYSIYGLKRRPTYEEIIGIIDESNEKITGKLPDRSATMFRNSPEGSYFDGSDSMEQLKEEQARLLMRQMSELLLRQNVRTAGRTFHTARAQQLPLQSPTIAQPTQPMDVEEEMPNQTPTMPSSSTQQASQLNAELRQRENTATKRKEETTMNHRGEVFKQNKPTIAEGLVYPKGHPQIYAPLGRPQPTQIPKPSMASQPHVFSIANDNEAQPPKPKPKRKAKASASASSLDTLQIPIVDVMEVSSSSKRATPEIEGKGGRPNMKHQKPDTSRPSADKREGSSPEEEPKQRKRRNKKGDMALGGGDEADDEDDEPKNKKGVRKTIQKPVGPSTIGVQRLREEFVNANNKGMITKEQYEQFDNLYKTWFASRGKDTVKKQLLKQMREVYKTQLFQIIKDAYKSQ